MTSNPLNPPQRRWLKRSLLVLGITFAILIGLWFWWSERAHRRLQAEIDAIHAAGEPIELADFQNFPVIPDNENAAVYYRRAYQAMRKPDQIDQANTSEEPLSPSSLSELNALVAGETAALALARQADDFPNAVWSIRIQRPVIKMNFPDLNQQRTFSKLLYAAALIAHQRGQDSQAIGYVRDLHCHADAMQQFFPFQVSE